MNRIFYTLLVIMLLIVTTTKASKHYHTDSVMLLSEHGRKIPTVLFRAKGKRAPLAIIIPGAGSVDLNGNQKGAVNNSFRLLAEGLAEQGVSTLRYSKEHLSDSLLEPLTIEHLSEVLLTTYSHARSRGYKNIYFVGHDQGVTVGLISAQKVDIQGFVGLCGHGSTADEYLKEQLRKNLPASYYNYYVVPIMDSLGRGQIVQRYPQQLSSLFNKEAQPFLISSFKYAPSELYGKLMCRKLIVQGGSDLQVDYRQARILAGESGLNQIVEISGMNHVLKHVPGDKASNLSSYNNPNLPIDQSLIAILSEFINAE